jgi:protein-disulfide isomerase
VQSDCEEGIALGLFYTPMIFVNGVEFKGWQVPGALKKTIDEVTAKHPSPLTASADRPVLALQKYVDDWREQPVRAFPIDRRAWSLGDVPAGSKGVDVVVFGDFQEPYTAAMDIALRDFMKGKSGIKYTFRHYPIDPTSNPTLPAKLRPEAVHPLAGKAAKAAEAAGSLGGADAYWKIHDWLMRNLQSFTDESLRDATRAAGLDPTKLFAEMQKPEVTEAINEDARAAQALGLTGVPMVFVNGKMVPRTVRERENIVIRIIEEVRKP